MNIVRHSIIIIIVVMGIFSKGYAQVLPETTGSPAIQDSSIKEYQQGYLSLQSGIITNSRTIGLPESLGFQNTSLFHIGLSWEEFGSNLFENYKVRSSISYSVILGHFNGPVLSDIAANLRFQANIGYTIYQDGALSIYPFVGMGGQRVRVDNTAGTFNMFLQCGGGADYLLPRTIILIGLRSGYNYAFKIGSNDTMV
jgi:hypothetical protein